MHAVCLVDALDALSEVADELLLGAILADLFLKVHERLHAILFLSLMGFLAVSFLLGYRSMELGTKSGRLYDRMEHLQVLGVLGLLCQKALIKVILNSHLFLKRLHHVDLDSFQLVLCVFELLLRLSELIL